MEALRVEGLSKNFGGLQVLKDLSFSIEAGKRVAIIGPNGAGKTTLLKLLTGELSATAGQIYMFGQQITTMPTHQCVQCGLACSYQITSLFSTLTVLDNILLACNGTKPSRFQMFRPFTAYGNLLTRAKELLESIGLWEKRDDLVQNISHGEQRQMELILCLASEPKLLLLDEPSAGLTSAEATSLIDIISNLPREITVLFVAHDMDVVFSLADEIMVLYYGQIIARGTPQEIQADPKVKEIYLGVEEDTADARAS